eukprot:GHVN01058307.1.p1 GENE.GHVN01058307.1~~GHVN01058307.1.p1  ORF type:complete len:150 (+),score=6.52 GHVN01058307.1:3-452(+)
MDVNYLLLINTAGFVRLDRWYGHYTHATRAVILHEIRHRLLQAEETSNMLEYLGDKIIFRRYANLHFVVSVSAQNTNEVLVLELIQRYVEALDLYFQNVCELDLVFDFQKAYHILDEMVTGGFVHETNVVDIVAEVQKGDEAEERPKRP